MPATINVNERNLILSPEFAYIHHTGDPVYYGEDQGVDGITNEGTLKPGDKLDSNVPFFVGSVGAAELHQYSRDEAEKASKDYVASNVKTDPEDAINPPSPDTRKRKPTKAERTGDSSESTTSARPPTKK